jgi:hypothetical protein
MTRTEERLADALDAAARALREDTLRPLLVPEGRRQRAAWAAPIAAAAGLLLVVGLGVAVARYLPGSGPSVAAGPPRYYVETSVNGGRPLVRSTATGAVTGTVEVPAARDQVADAVTAAANGLWFAAVQGASGARVYRFRLSAAGRVQGLERIPGGALGSRQWGVGVMAASPDGSRLAVSLTQATGWFASSCGSSSNACSELTTPGSPQNDQIDLIDTLTGTRSVWKGGIARDFSFTVLSLSWTSDASELAYFGQWCRDGNQGLASCEPGARGDNGSAQVWALNPASPGGSLTGGNLLFQVSPRFPDVPQAVISPDGTSIIAAALGGPSVSGRPSELTLEQIPVATRQRQRVLYRQNLGHIPGSAYARPNSSFFSSATTLSLDGAGQYWLLGGSGEFCGSHALCAEGFNGWIDDGRLVPLRPTDGSVASEAW